MSWNETMGIAVRYPDTQAKQHDHRPRLHGTYRVNLRHGVSEIRSGHRQTLGVIFHDAASLPICSSRVVGIRWPVDSLATVAGRRNVGTLNAFTRALRRQLEPPAISFQWRQLSQ